MFFLFTHQVKIQIWSMVKLIPWNLVNQSHLYLNKSSYILRRPQDFVKSSPYILLSYVVPVKNKVKISQIFVAFSEYVNFRKNVSKS